LSCIDLIEDEEDDQDGFLNHKFNHLLSMTYSVNHRVEEKEWHITFKLSSISSMKMVLLADLNG
jgi:hypothetical protein